MVYFSRKRRMKTTNGNRPEQQIDYTKYPNAYRFALYRKAFVKQRNPGDVWLGGTPPQRESNRIRMTLHSKCNIQARTASHFSPHELNNFRSKGLCIWRVPRADIIVCLVFDDKRRDTPVALKLIRTV